jgi:hypothetical protein
MSDARLDAVRLDSIWERILWDFLFVNPQLSDWLEGSRLTGPDAFEDGKPVFRLTVIRYADWLDVHSFVICRALSVEMQRPVVVRVVAVEGVK